MLSIGVDPGITGAICCINTKTREIRFWDTPTVTVKSGKSMKNQMNAHECSRILQALKDSDDILVTIEKVAPMPSFRKQNKNDEVEQQASMGVTSAFNFGMGFGIWQGICAASALPFALVHPATWKSKLMADMGKEKDASRVKAMQMFPETAKDLARKKDHGRADALLLAVYGARYGAIEQPAQPQAALTLFG